VRLDHGVAGEGGFRLVRLGQTQRRRRDDLEARPHEGRQFGRLAGVVGGRHQARSRFETQCHGRVLRQSKHEGKFIALQKFNIDKQ
jgi:hypothetical protein